MPTLPIVYRVFGHDGALLYVGVSSRGLTRLQQHAAARNERWLSVGSVTIEHHRSMPEALDAEARAIRAERPLWNRVLPLDGRTMEGRRIRRIAQPAEASA